MQSIPPYMPASIEAKWQKHWEDTGVLNAKEDYSMPKYYPLIEFPYPSGNGLHVEMCIRDRYTTTCIKIRRVTHGFRQIGCHG